MLPAPDLLARAAAHPEQLHWQSWAALAPGPALIVLGAVHGNEVCGAHAIAGTIDALQAGHLPWLLLCPVFLVLLEESRRFVLRRFVQRDIVAYPR